MYRLLKVARNQSGQTLIETMTALFMLSMGMTAAVGLAIYAFSASDNIIRQIVATGVAREGIEAVKNMRDTNWLKQSSINLDCYNFETNASSPNYPDPAGGARCYKNWLTQTYAIDPPAGNSAYRLRYNPAGITFWLMEAASNNYGLNSPDFTSSSFMTDPNFTGFYFHPTVPVASGNSPYYRKVTIIKSSPNAAFAQTGYERIQVISQVWWKGKNCPQNRTDVSYPAVGQKCVVTLETYLTNWKNY